MYEFGFAAAKDRDPVKSVFFEIFVCAGYAQPGHFFSAVSVAARADHFAAEGFVFLQQPLLHAEAARPASKQGRVKLEGYAAGDKGA